MTAIWVVVRGGREHPPLDGRLRRSGLLHQRRASRGLTRSQEVDASIDAPDQRHAERNQWLELGAVSHERADQIERHAGEVRQQSKYGDHEMPEEFEIRVLVEAHD